MEIRHIKQNLTLAQVLTHYDLQPNKNKMLNCPWHEDKTASLQVNLEKNFYKCHACGAKGDQIQWVQDYEKITKHEALKKCATMIDPNAITVVEPQVLSLTETERIQFLEKIFSSFRNAIFRSPPAREYCRERNLDIESLLIGFNGGQFHHGTRRETTLINHCLALGLLLDRNVMSRTGEKSYYVFGSRSIAFPLKNKENQIISLYFRSTVLTRNEAMPKHFYLKNRTGLYPNYPNPNTKKLILTESIIDAASLLQINEINKNYSLLSCYGVNGLTQEIQNAIKELQQLEEIIFAFDNDDAGKRATLKYAKELLIHNSKLIISQIELPNKDINETLQLHQPELFIELLEKRQPVIGSDNEANPSDSQAIPNTFFSIESNLNPSNELKSSQEPEAVIAKNEATTGGVGAKGLGAIAFLKSPDLLQRLNIEIGKAGIVGEENSRLLLFLIIISYMNKNPIHAIVQGSSGSGKTLIISRIADLMPQEDVLRFTRITESSLYNWGEFDLFGKVIIIEDLDGLKEDALYALRELISNQFLSSSVSIKDKKGNNKSAKKEVKGQFSSLSATTKGETYEDNMSRSFLIAVDESKEQTRRIIEYQNKRNAGEIAPKAQQQAIYFIQQIVRNLKHYEIINPYATKLQLPEKVHKIRRLNEMYQAVIKQVTFLNQYQRQVSSPSGRPGGDKLITTIDDIEQATEILFESIILKVDELDGSLRAFFERLKKQLKNKDIEFTQREIRQEFNISKSQCSRFFIQLCQLEYINLKYGGNLKSQKYVISYWDNYQKLRVEVKEFLLRQIEQLRQDKK